MARSLILDRETEPRFSQPIRQILSMVGILLAVGVLIGLIFEPVKAVFLGNIELTGFIFFVFVIGILSCFNQVIQLSRAVSWIEGFALDRPGHEFTRAPGLLASLAALLRGRDARRLLNPTSTRSILDSVATRLDESRDITRYITSVLIFLGLLGTFWGLSLTMPNVVAVIRSVAPQEGDTSITVFERLMGGLEGQLEGIGVAFSASLVGLAGSLVLGLLDLFAGHGQNRFYRELEEWLSSITRIGFSVPEAGGVDTGAAAALLSETARQIETLKDIAIRAEDRRNETDERIGLLAEAVAALVREIGQREGRAQPSDTLPVLERIASGQERMAAMMKEREEDSDQLDAETRMRLRNIDVQLLRILEEMAAGRQESVTDLRTEIGTLTRTIQSAFGRTADRQA